MGFGQCSSYYGFQQETLIPRMRNLRADPSDTCEQEIADRAETIVIEGGNTLFKPLPILQDRRRAGFHIEQPARALLLLQYFERKLRVPIISKNLQQKRGSQETGIKPAAVLRHHLRQFGGNRLLFGLINQVKCQRSHVRRLAAFGDCAILPDEVLVVDALHVIRNGCVFLLIVLSAQDRRHF